MIKLAVFDWNATILADVALTLQATLEEFAILGVPPFSLAHMQETFEIPLSHYYANMGIDPERISQHAQEMQETFHRHYEAGVNRTRTRPGARQLLDTLHARGVKRVILSNHHIRGIKDQLHRLKLDHHFDSVLANDDIHGALHMGKQARLEAYLQTFHIMPGEAFIIGDTAEEVAIGKALGLQTIAITGGMYSVKRLKAAKPDVLISSLHDLIDAIEEL